MLLNCTELESMWVSPGHMSWSEKQRHRRVHVELVRIVEFSSILFDQVTANIASMIEKATTD